MNRIPITIYLKRSHYNVKDQYRKSSMNWLGAAATQVADWMEARDLQGMRE